MREKLMRKQKHEQTQTTKQNKKPINNLFNRATVAQDVILAAM